jgi:hypothetical protein
VPSKRTRKSGKAKLGDIWEPSPFPVELSGADRESLASDPLFETTPWVSLPANLSQELPSDPGDTRFAISFLERQQRRIIWMPLSADEAKVRHETYQNYVLSTRLADGMLVCLRHSTGFSPYDPERPSNPTYAPRRTIYLDVYSPIGRINARVIEDLDERDLLSLCGLDLYQPDERDYNWSALVSRDLTIHTRDSRSGKTLINERPITPPELAICRFPLPAFGDIVIMLERVFAFLKCLDIDVPTTASSPAVPMNPAGVPKR